MRQILKMLACAGLIFAMAGCSSSKIDEDAVTKLETGMISFTEVESFAYNMGAKDPATSMDMSLHGAFMAKEKALSMVLDFSQASAGKTSTDRNPTAFMELYLKDGMFYMSAMGSKQKSEVDLSALDAFSLDADTLTLKKEQLEEVFDEVSLKNDVIHLVFKEELVKEAMKNQASLSSSYQIEGTPAMSMDISFDGDFIKNIVMHVSGKIDGKEETVDITFDITKINEVKSIEFPDDLDSYPTKDTSALEENFGL